LVVCQLDMPRRGCEFNAKFQDVFPEVYQKSEEILSGLQNRIDSVRRHVHERFDEDRRPALF